MLKIGGMVPCSPPGYAYEPHCRKVLWKKYMS